MLQDEVETSNMTSLRKITETMDMRIKEMSNLAVVISLDYIITYNSFIDDGYSRGKCVEELAKYSSSNMFINDILLYNSRRNTNKIYTTTGVYDLDILFNSIYKDYWNENDFLKTVDEIKMPFMRPSEAAIQNKFQEDNFVLYIFPLPVNSFRFHCVVMFQIKHSTLNNIVSDALKEYNGCTYILDGKNQPIFYHTSGQDKQSYLNLLNQVDVELLDPGIQNVDINNINYLISKSVSDYNGWSYITMMDNEQVFHKVSNVKKTLNLTVFSIFVLGSIIAFFFSLKQYKLLTILANLIRRKGLELNITNIIDKDEISFISRSIEYITDENSRLSVQLKNSMQKVKNDVMVSLLRSEKSEKNAQVEMFQVLGIKLEEGYSITVLVFIMDNYKDYFRAHDYSNKVLIKTDIINIMEEASSKVGKGYCVDLMDKVQIGLILCTKLNLESEIAIEKLVKNIGIFFEENYQISFTVGIGQTYNDVYMMKDSFEEALRAATYRLIYGRNKTILFRELGHVMNNFFKYTTSFKDDLKNAVKKADYDEAEQIIDKAMDCMPDSHITPEQVFCTYYGVVNSLINVIEELSIGIEEDNNFKFDDYMVNANFEVLDDLRRAVKQLCLKICKTIQSQWNSKEEILSNELIRLINDNYSDNSLSLTKIPEVFGISTSHCSKVFKKYTGYTIMQYVDNIRLEKVKELLRNSDDKLQDILNKTGYVDKVNFIRKFKKKEGITPIQYRNISKIPNIKLDTKS